MRKNESPSCLNHLGDRPVAERDRCACSIRAFSFSASSICPASSKLIPQKNNN